jgi:hypothetical protein
MNNHDNLYPPFLKPSDFDPLGVRLPARPATTHLHPAPPNVSQLFVHADPHLRRRRGLLKSGSPRFFLEVPVAATQRLTEKVGKNAADPSHVFVKKVERQNVLRASICR